MTETQSATHPVVRISRLLPALPQEVFEAWTDPESLKAWMCPGATTHTAVELDVRVGGRFRIVMRDEDEDITHSGEYREIRPPERLVFTWRSNATHGQATLVTVELYPKGEETELVLTHEWLPDTLAVEQHTGGWQSIIEKFLTHLTKKKGYRRYTMENHRVVSRAEWLDARKAYLAREKEFTRLRDQLSQQRRELPWVKVEKEYVFDGPNGKETLAELFAGRSQLLVYHFMFGPDWDEGCPSCSFWADNYNDIIVHLRHRNVTLVTVSRAPLERLEAYKKRMGWNFKWVSSLGTDFNRDYQVSFTEEEQEQGAVYYNYDSRKPFSSEGPGISVFYKDERGNVFHTYSCYARGLDMVNGAYHLLDLVPKGRDEAGLPYPMAWVRRHDRYED